MLQTIEMRRSCFIEMNNCKDNGKVNNVRADRFNSTGENCFIGTERVERGRIAYIELQTDSEASDYDETLVRRGKGGNYLLLL